MFKKSANLKCFKYCGQEYCGQEYCPQFGKGMKILSIQKKPKCRTLEEWLRTHSPRVDYLLERKHPKAIVIILEIMDDITFSYLNTTINLSWSMLSFQTLDKPHHKILVPITIFIFTVFYSLNVKDFEHKILQTEPPE